MGLAQRSMARSTSSQPRAAFLAQDDGRLDARVLLGPPNPGVKPGTDGSADQIERRIVAAEQRDTPSALRGQV
jgi:hypothetical protein